MKNLYRICFAFILSLGGATQASPTIDYSHFITPQEGVSLQVTDVASDDVLNLRTAPRSDAPILYRIPADADNVISYAPDIAQLVGKNYWVAVRLGMPDGYINGYVYARYLRYSRKTRTVKTSTVSARIPYFLESEGLASGWLRLYKSISANHYSGCDMRDQPELKYQLSQFDIQLKSYDSLRTALLETAPYEKSKVLAYYDPATNWFQNTDNSYFEARSDFSWMGFRQTIGAEGCGIHTYYFRRNGKILVMKLPFDDTPPIAVGDPIPELWSAKDKNLLISNTLDTVNVRNIM